MTEKNFSDPNAAIRKGVMRGLALGPLLSTAGMPEGYDATFLIETIADAIAEAAPQAVATRFEHRLRYENPYLKNQGRSEWTPAFPTKDAAVGYLQSWAVSNDYGTVLEHQIRRVTTGPWEPANN